MLQTAPIALFVYNRPEHTRQTIEGLRANPLASESELTVFSDGPKSELDQASVSQVRDYLSTIDGFRKISVIHREKNSGLAKSIIAGASEVLDRSGRIIVLEDDIVTAPGFLTYMNQGLEAYERNRSIFAICGWSPPIDIPASYRHDVYLVHRAMCWGWASWADRWQKIDWEVRDYAQFEKDREAQKKFARGGEDLPDMLRNALSGRVNSWAIRWAYAQFRQGALSVAPTKSLTDNVGMDGSGVNCSPSEQFVVTANKKQLSFEFPAVLEENPVISASFQKFFSYNLRGKIKKALGLL